MKIDIHTHTRKCKTGDASTREIDALGFCEVVQSTEVGIIAITNHNVFDKAQYDAIVDRLDGRPQVWPGIELDIMEGGSRGHLIVISSPKNTDAFNEAVKRITKGILPDAFSTTINEVLKNFDNLGPLYVAHYKQKAPSLSDDALHELQSKTSRPERVIKEVANSISAGIYISHGYSSIYGSDHHDWSRYSEFVADLPDLRLPVESFEHFCLLLKKDATTINTALDSKTNEYVELYPFEDGTKISLKVFNDINVVFGPKGTGKSCILRAIAGYYSDQGLDANVFVSASDRLDDIYDLKGASISLNLNPLGVNYCTDEIKSLRSAAEKPVTSISKYVHHFQVQTANKNSRRIRIKDLELERPGDRRDDFQKSNATYQKISEFMTFLGSNEVVKAESSNEDFLQISVLIERLLQKVDARRRVAFSGWKEIELLNSAISLFRTEVERKTGSPAKPTTTGFLAYSRNRIEIAANAKAILDSTVTAIPSHFEQIGYIGRDKGQLELRTDFQFQTGTITAGSLKPLKHVKKSAQKQFAKHVKEVFERRFEQDLFVHISKLTEDEDINAIETVYELLLFARYFVLEGAAYTPSSGEASMVMLQKELAFEKDIYILDEPERSLGNDYISDVIVPLIKERARTGRKIFISTHDANIAVRTLPYSSIYRTHGTKGYETYVGNPFSNNLVGLTDPSERLDWRDVSMRTLEGGVEAFGERGTIYGKS